MADDTEQDDGQRFVNCIRCAHALTWFQHTQLRFAMNCPKCGATEQFGPGVYVDDFKGITLQELVQRRAAKARQMRESA